MLKDGEPEERRKGGYDLACPITAGSTPPPQLPYVLRPPNPADFPALEGGGRANHGKVPAFLPVSPAVHCRTLLRQH